MMRLKRLTIPPKTTGELQPLDYGLFRYCKDFCKKIFFFVILENIIINLKERNNIIIMWSLIFNQFNSDLFTPFFKNAWNALCNNPQKNENRIMDNLFKFNKSVCDLCNSTAFIKCSHCNVILCFDDFFIKYHFH